MKKILPVILILLAVAGYMYYDLVLKQKINGSTLIDNPTAQVLNVSIDGKSYTVPANAFLKIDLPLGQHSLTCTQYGLKDTKLLLDPVEYGVINPTKSKYVVYNIIYTEKDLRSQFQAYQVEGREVYSLLGAPEVTDALFVPDRTMGKGNIDDKEPAVESYSRMNQDYAYLMKIFRLKDFFDFYDKQHK